MSYNDELKPFKVNINKSLLYLAFLAFPPAVCSLTLLLFGDGVRLGRGMVSLGLRVHEDEAGEDGDDGDENDIVFEVMVNGSYNYLALIV